MLKRRWPWVTLHWFFPLPDYIKAFSCMIETTEDEHVLFTLGQRRSLRWLGAGVVGSAAPLFTLQYSEQGSGWAIMNRPHNKCSEHPVVIFWCGKARIHTLITAHTRKWVLTIPLHLAVPSCFHLLWITWLRAPPGPTGAENRSDLLFNSAGETVNIFFTFSLRWGGS